MNQFFRGEKSITNIPKQFVKHVISSTCTILLQSTPIENNELVKKYTQLLHVGTYLEPTTISRSSKVQKTTITSKQVDS